MITFDTEELHAATVVRPVGRLDMVAAPKLRSLLASCVDGGARRLVVDLEGTEFIDSSGLGAIVTGLKLARQAGGDLRIACVGGQVATVLKLTTLDRVLRAHASVEEAAGAAG